LNEERYVYLLEKLIGETKFLQNKPPTLIPKESLIGNHVEAHLGPYLKENGGPFTMERIEYTPGRNNIIITYPGTTDTCISFVGSHMDVVPANPEEWERDPFKLERDGDILFGRGTTDCLGHVALLTELLVHLGTTKPKLAVTIVVVFIANEENSEIQAIGVDGLVSNGKLTHLKKGYMFWVDTSDTHPCIGTAACRSWRLHVKGLMGHSGLPHKAINPLILGYEVVTELCQRVHETFPKHPKEELYCYECPSTMKVTMIEHPSGAVNQIPGQATFRGDIRLTPFYNLDEVSDKIMEIAYDISQRITTLPGRCPGMGYQVGDKTASFEFILDHGAYRGIACNLESPGFLAYKEATKEVLGEVKPFSVCGSLPLVYELQQEGFDLQLAGFGLSAKYHGTNEYSLLSKMANGFQILQRIINKINVLMK